MFRTVPTKLRLLIGILIATVAACAVAAAPAAAADCDLYAAPSGSDSAAGSLERPLRTAQRLADSLDPGETGCLRAGEYTSSRFYVLSFEHGGSPGSPITIRSAPGETATLVGIVNVPRGSDNVTLSNLVIEGTGESNTVKIYAADTVIENNEITNKKRGLSCMMLGNNDGAGPAIRPIVRQNVFHACGKPGGNPSTGARDHGIYSAASQDAQIVDNLFYDIATYTIQLYPNTQSATVANNVIDGGDGSVRGGVVFGSEDGYASNNNTVVRNVIAYTATHAVTTWWGDAIGKGNVAQDNCVWAAAEGEFGNKSTYSRVNNIVADPGFLNRAARDYRLSPDSPCLTKVGYDTAAKIMGYEQPVPQPAKTADSGSDDGAPAGRGARPSSSGSRTVRRTDTAIAGELRTRSTWRKVDRNRASKIKLMAKAKRRGARSIVRGAGRVSTVGSRARVVLKIRVGKRWRVLGKKRANAQGKFRFKTVLAQRVARNARLRAVLPGVARSPVLDL